MDIGMKGAITCAIIAAFLAGIVAGWGLYHSPRRVNNNYITYKIENTYRIVSENGWNRTHQYIKAYGPESGEI